MKYQWLHQTKHKQLLLFFSGWGCVASDFKHLVAEQYDVLMIYDYLTIDLPLELKEVLSTYDSVSVVAWSFGVWVAQATLPVLNLPLGKVMAINGTLKPVDDAFGIPIAIAQGTLANLSERNLLKFQRRMVSSAETWTRFSANRPVSDVLILKAELAALYHHFVTFQSENSMYSDVVICSNDLIFSSDNMIRFWDDKLVVISLHESHFCFYAFNSWDEVVNLSANSPQPCS